MPERVGVVGASARAAVHSLARAGLAAWAVDLFGDRDLRQVARWLQCPLDHYPAALPDLASRFPSGPLLYTGGLENYPELITKLAAKHELWGNPPEVIEHVRDPYLLAAALADKGFAHPTILSAGAPCPATGRWLVKARRSSGGSGVRVASPGHMARAGSYLQEFVPGIPMSAVFVVDQSGADLFGVTEQLIGIPWLHSRPFGYAGNIGPVELAASLRSELTLLGLRLSGEFGLRAVFGVDFILNEGRPWVVEVNPRYLASIEVIEHATRRALWGPMKTSQPDPSRITGKAIYYAPKAITFPPEGPWDADLTGSFDPWRLPGFADIPHPGTTIAAGWPVLTLFAAGSSPAIVRERLQSQVAELDQLFSEASP